MIPCRFIVLILANAALTLMFSNTLAMNFTIICMNDVAPENATDHWLREPAQVNSLFSMIAVGMLLGTLALTHLTHMIGLRGVTTFYLLLSAIGTLLLPLAVDIGYWAVVVARIAQGVSTSLSFPVTGLVASQWAATTAVGTFVAILSCHLQFASMFTMPISGALCESSLGWRSVFYLHGVLSIVVMIAFYMFYRDDPKEHKYISKEELAYIQKGKELQIKGPVPYRAIITDPCAWSNWLSTTSVMLGFQVFYVYGPTYMNKVLKLDVRATGWATAFPFLLSAIAKFSSGPISDHGTCIKPRTRIVLFATSSQIVMSLCFVALAYTTDRVLAQIVYNIALVFSGINCVGTLKGAQMVYRQHVHFVMAVMSLILCFMNLAGPIAVAEICPDNTAEEWSRLFIYVAIFMSISSVPFIIFARDQPAPCTQQVFPSEEKKQEIEC